MSSRVIALAVVVAAAMVSSARGEASTLVGATAVCDAEVRVSHRLLTPPGWTTIARTRFRNVMIPDGPESTLPRRCLVHTSFRSRRASPIDLGLTCGDAPLHITNLNATASNVRIPLARRASGRWTLDVCGGPDVVPRFLTGEASMDFPHSSWCTRSSGTRRGAGTADAFPPEVLTRLAPSGTFGVLELAEVTMLQRHRARVYTRALGDTLEVWARALDTDQPIAGRVMWEGTAANADASGHALLQRAPRDPEVSFASAWSFGLFAAGTDVTWFVAQKGYERPTTLTIALLDEIGSIHRAKAIVYVSSSALPPVPPTLSCAIVEGSPEELVETPARVALSPAGVAELDFAFDVERFDELRIRCWDESGELHGRTTAWRRDAAWIAPADDTLRERDASCGDGVPPRVSTRLEIESGIELETSECTDERRVVRWRHPRAAAQVRGVERVSGAIELRARDATGVRLIVMAVASDPPSARGFPFREFYPVLTASDETWGNPIAELDDGPVARPVSLAGRTFVGACVADAGACRITVPRERALGELEVWWIAPDGSRGSERVRAER